MSLPPSNDWGIVLRLVREARSFRWHLLAVLLLALLSAPLALLTPVPIKLAVDHVLGTAPLSPALAVFLPAAVERSSELLLIAAAALVVLVAVLQNLEGYASWYLQLYVGEKLTVRIKARLLVQAQRLSLLYHDRRGTSDTLYRIQYDAPAAQLILVQGLVPLIASVTTVVAMFTILLRVSPSLAFVALAILPLLAGTSQLYRRHVRIGWERVKENESKSMAILQETLGALRVVKAFGQESREQARFERQAGRSLREHLRVVGLESGFGLVVAAIVGGGAATVLWLGVRQVQTGQITLGSLLLILGYIAQLYKPLETVSKKIATLQASLASAQRAFALLDERPDVAEAPRPRSLRRARGQITFERVSFAYTPHRPVLRHADFSIPAGARVGVSGPTGAGKTTLISLLPRFFDPTEGRILLDGVDLRDYRLADLRAQFAIVLQEPVLFSTTISENIAYSRPDAARHEIEAAAEAANALQFIRALRQGFDTVVGERGMTLSGGERQRISLARAFLKDAPILLLDEPTSSVDGQSEGAILDALERLMAGRTTFMIAHRIDTLERCEIRLRFSSAGVEVEHRSTATAHARRSDDHDS